MFGRGKKEHVSIVKGIVSRHFDESVIEEYSFTNYRILPEDMPIRKDGLRNGSISLEMLDALPPHWKRFWNLIDLDFAFGEEKLEESAPEPTNLMKISETAPDLLPWMKDKKIKLKAIELGELSEENYQKFDFDKFHKKPKSNREYANDNQRGFS